MATSLETIAVDALRVGMYIHLDMGWLAHPFPLGSFRIASDAQIATIRSLGVRQIRWSRAQSHFADEAGEGAAASDEAVVPPVDAASTAGPASPAAPPRAVTASAPKMAVRVTSAPSNGGASRATVPVRVPVRDRAPASAPAAAAARHAADQAALRLCERQFTEAAQDCRSLTDLVVDRPAEARGHAELLSKALVGKMLGAGDLCVRLLTVAAGDKAASHALNVAVIALLMGRTFGLPEAELTDLGVGALLHDIGKLDLPERVRHRDDAMSGSELRFYEEHVARGVAQARRLGLSPGATQVIAQHHEHADGSGFPLRLNTDRMTAAARIVALVDRYDNLCNPNLAARALTPHESLSLLFAQGHNRFDTAILGAFIRMMGVYPAGSTVQLTDDRFALVVGVNSSRPLKPRVLVHDPRVPRSEAPVLDLETSGGIGIRRSLRPALLPPPALAYLAPQPRVAYFFEPVPLAAPAVEGAA